MSDFKEFITWSFEPMYLMVNYTKALTDTHGHHLRGH